MRNMRKLLSLLLALVMVFSLSVTAFAADGDETEETYTITIPAGDAHNYEIYQIFTGDLHEGVLSNIKWGANGIGETEALVDEDTLDAVMAASGSNAEKLDVILNYVNLNTPFETVTGSATEDVKVQVAPGYYLLKDASLPSEDDAYTTFIVLVVKDVEISRKAAKPGIDKQVWDEADDAETAGQNWGETADHELNESFQFKLIATLTGDEDYADYKTYKLIFHDSMSAGITFESIDKVTVNGEEISGYTYSATAGQAGGEWTLTIADLKQFDTDLTDGCVVEVIYNAHLNNNAVIGNKDDNLNDVYLEYSNNPNWDLTWGNDGKDNDNDGEEDEDDEKDEPTGKTEKDTVWVFTYQIDVTKVDGANADKKLPNAEFKLQNAAGEWLIVNAEGKVQSWTEKKDDGSVLKSNEQGVFSVIGLDHGTYYLVETKAPEGYNLLDKPFEVTISAVHQEDTVITASTSFGEDVEGDSIVVTVENKAGIVLPETGGMGTTMIYILGAVMVLGAGVLLVTKRRMAM